MPRAASPRRRRRVQTARGGLKGFAEARKTKIDLLKDVQTHVVAQDARSGNDHREKHKIHVSEVVKDACPRMLFYKISGVEPTDAAPGAWHQLVSIWSAGSAEHEKWQRWLREMGDLWGTWTCLVCEHSWEALAPDECEKCESGLLRYDEVHLEVEDMFLVGHADGAVPRLNSLVEIKSFSAGSVRVENPGLVAEHTHKVEGRSVIDQDSLWKSVKRPLKSHLVQGLFYLWMCREMGMPYDKIIYIYENKTTQATKAFEVKLTERLLTKYLDVLTEVVDAAKAGEAPERPSLYAADAKPCSTCLFRTECWGENDDQSAPSTTVPSGRPRPGGEEAGREAAVRPSRASDRSDPSRPRRHHGVERRRSDRVDDSADQMGRAPRSATGDGGGGREVGRRGEGEGPRPRFARRRR